MAGNDVTWSKVTRIEPEVTSLHGKGPGQCCRRPKSCFRCTSASTGLYLAGANHKQAIRLRGRK